MKLAVIGSRTFNNYKLLCEKIDDLRQSRSYDIDTIVSGGAKGADSLAITYAEDHNLLWEEYLPDWETWGKSAGFRRNQLIIDAADVVIAFWDGKSRGTAHSIGLAGKQNKPVLIIKF